MYIDSIKKIIRRSEELPFIKRKDTGAIYFSLVSNALLPKMPRGITWLG